MEIGRNGNSPPPSLQELKNQCVFVAHWRAISDPQLLEFSRVWVSGTSSWFRLAQKGIWVEGCAESLGFHSLVPTLESPVLQLKSLKNWVVLTHDTAVKTWNSEAPTTILATYRMKSHVSEDAIQALKKSTHVFWGSGSQYENLKNDVPQEVVHACGPGKTFEQLSNRLQAQSHQSQLLVFPNIEEWKKWIQKEKSRIDA